MGVPPGTLGNSRWRKSESESECECECVCECEYECEGEGESEHSRPLLRQSCVIIAGLSIICTANRPLLDIMTLLTFDVKAGVPLLRQLTLLS